MGWGSFPYGIHANLYVEDCVADLTEKGVGVFDCTDPFDDPDNQSIYIFPCYTSALICELALALRQANVKTDKRDLWRCALQMQPVDPVCTTFVALLLGIGTPVPYEPIALLNHLDSLYYDKEGIFWTRNGVRQWNRKNLPSSTII